MSKLLSKIGPSVEAKKSKSGGGEGERANKTVEGQSAKYPLEKAKVGHRICNSKTDVRMESTAGS